MIVLLNVIYINFYLKYLLKEILHLWKLSIDLLIFFNILKFYIQKRDYFMKKYLFILSFMLLVLFSEQECKGPDGDSKPTPFRKEASITEYKYYLDMEGVFYSLIIFAGVALPLLYIVNKKID